MKSRDRKGIARAIAAERYKLALSQAERDARIRSDTIKAIRQNVIPVFAEMRVNYNDVTFMRKNPEEFMDIMRNEIARSLGTKILESDLITIESRYEPITDEKLVRFRANIWLDPEGCGIDRLFEVINQ